MAAGVLCSFVDEVPADGLSVIYSALPAPPVIKPGRVYVSFSPDAWRRLAHGDISAILADPCCSGNDLSKAHADSSLAIRFDLFAHAFCFLTSAEERRTSRTTGVFRATFSDSVYARTAVPQDIVDRYLDLLLRRLELAAEGASAKLVKTPVWPTGKAFAVVLSHDVDFLPEQPADNVKQGVRTILRHLIKQRDVVAALRSAAGLASAFVGGRDPYGCIPEMLSEERARGVRASYQVAVGHRHPSDVNYRVQNPRTAEYLRVLCGDDADLCLHGSVRSTENPDWYVEEVETLACHLARPLGSRQHYLSFDYDALFSAQERAGIQYDMSLGYPDQIGSRCGFSYPFFPYNLEEDRPYDVLQISLFLMDVTLQSYLGLRADRARAVVRDCLDGVRRRGGCVSIVWHPIVFGGARDPGYDGVYWDLVDHVLAGGGLATDGRTINDWWRARAVRYASFRSPRADAAATGGSCGVVPAGDQVA